VHPEVPLEVADDELAFGDPERHMVKDLRLHERPR
jgi:hypothetical protein